MYFANLKKWLSKIFAHPDDMSSYTSPAPINCLSLDDFLDFSMPQFLHLYDGDNSINDQMS